ncbi:MAG: glycerophosphodiester phosphodiesterase family protein [Leucobacter sp.]
MPHPYLTGTARPRVFAHRGFVAPSQEARGIAENTLAAFAAARDAGAEYIESDCHLSRDGRVVLFHDDDLLRVTGDPRKIAEVTHRELSAIMADRGGLLTLDEALEAFPEARFNLDVKAEAAAEAVGRAVAHDAHRVLLASFTAGCRIAALRAAAAVPAAAAVGRPATSPDRAALVRILLAVAVRSRRRAERALAGFDALQVPERQDAIPVLTRALIDAAHANGVEVHVWTVNDAERMRSLAARGVDGVITDRTDLALAALR